MWSLVFAMAAGLNIAACEQELGHDEVAQEICRIPNITIVEAREMYHLRIACIAIKTAVEASGRQYLWVELKGNDGYTARCYLEGH